jgi:hypothetical protein
MKLENKMTNKEKVYINSLQEEIKNILRLIQECERTKSGDYTRHIITLSKKYTDFKSYIKPFESSMTVLEKKHYNDFLRNGDLVTKHYDELIKKFQIEVINENIVKITL